LNSFYFERLNVFYFGYGNKKYFVYKTIFLKSFKDSKIQIFFSN